MKISSTTLTLLLVFVFQNCFSQNEVFKNYETQLQQLGVAMDLPTEGRGEFLKPLKKSFVPHLFRVKMKKENLRKDA